MIWEDENSYYLFVRFNYAFDDIKSTNADGYKVEKENGRLSRSRDDREQVLGFYTMNEKPIYEEENVTLLELDFRESQML